MGAAEKSFFFSFALRHKKAALREGFLGQDSFWDRLVFADARAEALVRLSLTLRGVIVSGGTFSNPLHLIQISDDVERLKREADDIINSANLVELTMQYSNKYADKDTIKQAQKKSMQLYDEYNYKEALDTIATAIEKVEPGSYQRLENAYYSEQKE